MSATALRSCRCLHTSQTGAASGLRSLSYPSLSTVLPCSVICCCDMARHPLVVSGALMPAGACGWRAVPRAIDWQQQCSAQHPERALGERGGVAAWLLSAPQCNRLKTCTGGTSTCICLIRHIKIAGLRLAFRHGCNTFVQFIWSALVRDRLWS